ARGQLCMIGATTYGEYKQYLESDAAFMRRFQIVSVPEPSPREVRNIISGVSSRYAEFHGVQYEEEALDAIVELSHQYIGSTHFPDKAIKVVDRAGVIGSLFHNKKEGTVPRINTSCVVDAVAQISNLPRERIAQNQEAQLESLQYALSEALIGQAEPIEQLI